MKIKSGDSIPDWIMESVSPEKMKTMAALLRDPNPVHWDKDSVDAIGFGQNTINQGPLGLSYMINMLHAWVGPENIRRVVMTFPKIVFDEDRIIAKGTVKNVRVENSETLADCDIWLHRGDNDSPLVGTATVKLPEHLC